MRWQLVPPIVALIFLLAPLTSKILLYSLSFIVSGSSLVPIPPVTKPLLGQTRSTKDKFSPNAKPVKPPKKQTSTGKKPNLGAPFVKPKSGVSKSQNPPAKKKVESKGNWWGPEKTKPKATPQKKKPLVVEKNPCSQILSTVNAMSWHQVASPLYLASSVRIQDS
jgi:hypothetical protein